ncbi:probable cytochrome P450 6a13 [Planococcus citri]|uniref:probable cytochrome P450 6a13 n=1 Tax=Planococcus citri TaxID=170843 RepID=UPI0031F9F2F0
MRRLFRTVSISGTIATYLHRKCGKMDYYTCTVVLIASLVIFLYQFLKKRYSFFERCGIPYIKPTILFGNTIDIILLRKSMGEVFAELYKKLEPHRFGGIFAATKPMIMIRDPNLLKDILIKDFVNFSDRGWDVDHTLEPLTNHLFTMHNDDWRNLRMKLNSVFTSGKLKTMFPLVKVCGDKLSEVIGRIPENESFDAKDLMARYATDVIGSCVFGLDTKSMDDPNAEFRMMGRKLSQFRLRSMLRLLQFDVVPQKLAKLLKITFFDLKTQHYFGDIVLKTIEQREKTNAKRNDLIDFLIAMKNGQTSEKYNNVGNGRDFDLKITDELLAAQGFIFFFAGYETSSTSLSYILLELSQKQNKHIQDKIRQEILDITSANSRLTYDVLKQMPYTDMVIDEILRKYPPNGILQRRAIKNYKIPNSDAVIPAGTAIIVSIYGLHCDEKYFDNPQEFRPERFTEEEKSKRLSCTYLPFGTGPRYCIGASFAKIMVKIGLIYALRNYSYRTSPKMKFPLEFDKNLGLLTPCNSILLQREKIL